MYLHTWSFGGVSGVVLPYEMFCESGMAMKTQSPFEKIFIVGYSWPSYCTYVPTWEAFELGGYEVGNCQYERGTAEKMVEQYLTLLESMYASK